MPDIGTTMNIYAGVTKGLERKEFGVLNNVTEEEIAIWNIRPLYARFTPKSRKVA